MSAGAQRDYYDILGVDRSATTEEVKRAYKRLAILLHPDRNPDDPTAEERFKIASAAYSILSDPDKRRRYDRMGHAAFTGAGAGGQGGFEQVDFGGVAEILEGLIGDVFGSRRKKKGPRDVSVDLRLSFEEAALGVEKVVRVERPVACTECNGSGSASGSVAEVCAACGGKGQVRYQRGFFAAARTCQACNGAGKRITQPCAKCNGGGTVTREDEMTVRIPAGVDDGAVRTVRGGGEQGPSGAGDLHVYVRIDPHPLFTREGADVRCTVPISFPQAVLGAQVDVPSLQGKVVMRIPPGTQSGKVFRLRGKGIAVFGGAGKGDQLVKVLVEVPEKITRSQRKLIEQLADEMDADAHPQQKSFLEKLKTLFG